MSRQTPEQRRICDAAIVRNLRFEYSDCMLFTDREVIRAYNLWFELDDETSQDAFLEYLAAYA